MIVRQNFPDLILEDALPALNQVTFDTIGMHDPVGPKVFRMLKSSRAIEQDTEVSGLGQLSVVAEGANVRYDQPVQGHDKTYTHLQYALGYKITRPMLDDQKFGLARDLARQLGRSLTDTRETLLASVFNNGFSDTGPDGVSLFSTSHPLVKSGGVYSNHPSSAADLSVDSLQLALTDFRAARSHSGKRLRIQPRKLLIPPEEEFNAVETLNIGHDMRGDTANNTTNAFNHRPGGMAGRMDVIVWEYLTDPDAWFLLADASETGIKHYEREAPNTVHEIDFDSRSAKTALWTRFSFGYSHPWGVYGNPGA